ncbi:sugar phosphate isomerase/epimerase family protein [Vallitalea okinawensis]|uniref:sugar phosphate isomerase/epimerase family protein n=1 Tax=Vallitalea okinawensis TaxID=2078660 RepID=UPI000CFCC392|nr:sugar phosphate isomerase/epimerase family protein [Vallitalea okinawensis]
MRLGIIGKPEEESFILASKRNLSFLEFTINQNIDVDDFMDTLPNLKKWIDKYEIGIGSIGRWGTDRIDEEGNCIEAELEKSYQLIDACHELDCPVFVCGCNYIKTLTYKKNCEGAINYFQKLIEYGKKKNVKIATNNCRWNNFIHGPQAWQIVHMELEELGIKYDPSHCYYSDGDYLAEIRDWGHRILHFHLKGALKIQGKRYDDPPAGMGQIDWRSVMATLYAVGYDKGLSIEPHSQTWQGELGEKGIDYTINFIRPFML